MAYFIHRTDDVNWMGYEAFQIPVPHQTITACWAFVWAYAGFGLHRQTGIPNYLLSAQELIDNFILYYPRLLPAQPFNEELGGYLSYNIKVTAQFQEYDGRGIYEQPESMPPQQFWHSIIIMGMNTRRGYFIIRNSWGANWGYHGFARVSLDCLQDICYASEWEIILPPPTPPSSPEDEIPVQQVYYHY